VRFDTSPPTFGLPARRRSVLSTRVGATHPPIVTDIFGKADSTVNGIAAYVGCTCPFLRAAVSRRCAPSLD
jgi:hypothetical protein